MPWILLQHVLQESNRINCVDNFITTLDIYNDAAQRALHVIKEQYIYDEIEAEVMDNCVKQSPHLQRRRSI